MANCNACGAALETFEYQTRAADEAHTSVTTCPSCPVSAEKISTSRIPRVSPKGMIRRIHRSMPVNQIASTSYKCGYILRVDIPKGNQLYDVDLDQHHLVQRVSLRRQSTHSSRTPDTIGAFFSVNCILKDMCIKLRNTQQLGMNVYLDVYEIYSSRKVEYDNLMIKGSFTKWSAASKQEYIVYNRHGDSKRSITAYMGLNHPSKDSLATVVSRIYSFGMIPGSAGVYIGNDIIAKLANLSPRAWDASTAPKSNHRFTSKPDGQRVWLIWVGNIWYICQPKGRYINKWIWTNKYQEISSPIVVDAEYMLSRGYVMIDFLTDSHGNISPISRDINWITEQFNNIIHACPELPLSKRQYFTSSINAERYSHDALYPTDGIIAIKDGSTEILKIKPFRSMELLLKDNYLVTAELEHVLECPGSMRYAEGKIIEVRFIASDNTPNIEIIDMFERTDKSIANSSSAVKNIIASAYKTHTPDDNERRVALLWCNSLRESIIHTAISRNTNKAIVIDVGTGAGQSLDSFPERDDTSYVFIEPDSNRCKSIAHRLKRWGNIQILTSPFDIISHIKGLKTRSKMAVILNCTLGDIADNNDASRALFSEARCIICTFSIHFIVTDLHDLTVAYDIPIYGCGYAYDTIDENGVLIDECGVTMKADNAEATVKWGGDRAYTEPVTRLKDYTGLGRVIHGGEVKVLPDMSFSPGANTICSKVFAVLQ